MRNHHTGFLFVRVVLAIFLACVFSLQASAQGNPMGANATPSNASAIPGRLSSDQMKAILAAADEEKRRAFSDLVQQTSALPSALLSTTQGFRRTYPRSGIGKCEQKTSELQARLGPSLNPKQVSDISEMNQLLPMCAATLSGFAPPNYRNISVSVDHAITDEDQRQQQIENARNAILQAEGALDASDLGRAKQLFRGMAGTSSLPSFAQSYLQQTQGLRQDLERDKALLASVIQDSALMKLLAQQAIEVVSSQPGPGDTFMVTVRSTTANITVVLFCSNDVVEREDDCGRPLKDKDTFSATLLPADHQLAYKHYPTWNLQGEMAKRTVSIYAIYKVSDSQGHSYEARYPDKSVAKTQFAENGGIGRYLDMDHLQSQDKTDEQAVCLHYIQKHEAGEYNRPDYLAVPTVDCYDHITYTHVILTNSGEMGKAVRGIIVRDNRPGSCGSSGCAIRLFYQGGPNNPGDEECQYCKNAWSPGIDAVGTDIKVTTADHQGWYDVAVTRRSQSGTSGVEQTSYRRVGDGLYDDVAAIAKAKKAAADGAALRRSVALSLGLQSTQSQAVVKAILAAHGYSRLEDGTGQTGPWNCISDGWKGGRWQTSCISKKGDVTIRFLFELGKMYRNPDTGALQQMRTDHLLFASFMFDKYDFPDNTLHLVSPTLKKCNGKDDGDGVCFNF